MKELPLLLATGVSERILFMSVMTVSIVTFRRLWSEERGMGSVWEDRVLGSGVRQERTNS